MSPASCSVVRDVGRDGVIVGVVCVADRGDCVVICTSDVALLGVHVIGGGDEGGEARLSSLLLLKTAAAASSHVGIGGIFFDIADVVVVPEHIRCSAVAVVVDMFRARAFFCRKCAASGVEP